MWNMVQGCRYTRSSGGSGSAKLCSLFFALAVRDSGGQRSWCPGLVTPRLASGKCLL